MQSTRFALWGIGILILLATSACGIGSNLRGPRFGNDATFGKGRNVRIVCSEMCQARGQCGLSTTDAGDPVYLVLMNEVKPASRNQDMSASENWEAEVVESKPEKMIVNDTDQAFDVTYYLVKGLAAASDGQQTEMQGWVQGTCVSNQVMERE